MQVAQHSSSQPLQLYQPTAQTHPSQPQHRSPAGPAPSDLFALASRHMEALMDGFFRADPFAASGGFGFPMLGMHSRLARDRLMLAAGDREREYARQNHGLHLARGRQDAALQARGEQSIPTELARFTSFDQILRDFEAVTFPDFGPDAFANDPQNLGTGSFSQVFVARQKMGADGKMHTEKYFNTNINGLTSDGDRIGQKEEMYQNTEQNLKRIAQQKTLNDQGLKIVKSRYGDQPEEVHTIQHGFEDSGRADFERRWLDGSRRIDFSRALTGPSYSRNANQLTSVPSQSTTYLSAPFISSVPNPRVTTTAPYSSQLPQIANPVVHSNPTQTYTGISNYQPIAASVSPVTMATDYQAFNASQEPIVIRSERRSPTQSM